MKEFLFIFAKNPLLGKVKTRLAQSLGDEKALQIYELLLEHTQKITHSLSCDKAVFYADFIAEGDLWNEGIYQKYLQQGQNLGERMYKAFQQSFEQGYERVVIIGSDCRELQTAHIQQAFKHLTDYKVVIGPAKDGGYYLLGMTKLFKTVFEHKTWSTPSVFADTIRDLEQENISYALLPELSDVDVEEDLQGWDWEM